MSDFIPLSEAAKAFNLTVGGLRAERDAGRLIVYRVRGKDYTTREAMREMFQACRLNPKTPGSGYGCAQADQVSGLSSITDVNTALAAARATIAELKDSCFDTSAKNSNRLGQSSR